MRTFAPGKLVLTGAYVVLEGAPAIAVAVSRGAFADAARAALAPTPEVRAALPDADSVPHADASEMFVGARKLGLGASAAILVASLAALDAKNGTDLSDRAYRERLFDRAWGAHSEAQGGGSGIDVAASVFGGAIRYTMPGGGTEHPSGVELPNASENGARSVGESVASVAVPETLRIAVFACGTSARTSELRAEVDRFGRTNPAAHRACMNDLTTIANDAATAIDAGDAEGFVRALRATARGLARLGEGAGIGIVPAGFDTLEAAAEEEGASFSVSGAGGGDVAVFVGPNAPSRAFLERAHALGLFPLDVTLDADGVRAAPVAPEARVPRSSRTGLLDLPPSSTPVQSTR